MTLRRSTPALDALITSWTIHLRAANLSANTIGNYLVSVGKLSRWCANADSPTDPALQRPVDIQSFIAHELDTGFADSTVAMHYRCLQQWFRWLHDEAEIDANPMARLRPPKVGERPVPVFSDAELERLIAACSGRHWLDRRDLAIIRLLIDTGGRLDEIASLELVDVDLATATALVRGKGNRRRIVPFGTKTTQALDRYIRARARRPHADSPRLWLGRRGPILSTAIGPMLKRRALVAHVDDVHPHRFRHTLAHRWLTMGGQEGDLMAIAGWRSRQMLARYGASAAAERARDAHRRLAPGDSIG